MTEPTYSESEVNTMLKEFFLAYENYTQLKYDECGSALLAKVDLEYLREKDFTRFEAGRMLIALIEREMPKK